MTLQRITNVSLFNNTLRHVQQTQGELYELQTQISSGLKARDFKGLNGQVEQYIGLSSQQRRLDLYQQNGSVIEARLNTANQAVTNIIDVADKMTNLMIQRRGTVNETNSNFNQQLKDLLQQVADSMNITLDGRYLLSGASTNTEPVPNINVANVVQGVPDTGYYAGSTEDVTQRIDEGVELPFPVRGDDIGFQRIFAAANLALQPQASDIEIKQAIDLMQKAQQDVNAIQAKLNSSIVNIQQLNERQGQMKLYLQGLSENISKTDIVAATTKVANDQALLQASYQVFARLIQLKLSDYL